MIRSHHHHHRRPSFDAILGAGVRFFSHYTTGIFNHKEGGFAAFYLISRRCLREMLV